jgi:hypothetical protein
MGIIATVNHGVGPDVPEITMPALINFCPIAGEKPPMGA